MKPDKSRLSSARLYRPKARTAAAFLALAALILMAAGESRPAAASEEQAWGKDAAVRSYSYANPTDDAPHARRKPRKKHRQAAVSWAALSSRYPGAFATKGPAAPRRAALTFDDVPDNKYTPQVLDILAREHAPATFFVVGQRAAAYPDMVQRMKREGHAVGSHSYDHTSFARLSLEAFESQVQRTDAVLEPLLGFTPRFIRPPYGEIKPEQLSWTQGHGYFVVNWNVDTEDWKGLSADKIIANVKRTLAPGSIILQHAGGGVGEDLSGTVSALPKIIAMLREKGYQLVTVPELLGESEAVEEITSNAKKPDSRRNPTGG